MVALAHLGEDSLLVSVGNETAQDTIFSISTSVPLTNDTMKSSIALSISTLREGWNFLCAVLIIGFAKMNICCSIPRDPTGKILNENASD